MRWIDIPLPQPGECPPTDRLIAEAQDLLAALPALQEQHGLDAPRIAQHCQAVGWSLFQAVTAADAGAFRPDADRPGAETPSPATGDTPVLGYHVVAPEPWLGLPWHWLHNGMTFLLENHALAAAPHGSRVPELDPPRLWMQRHSDALFASGAGTEASDEPRTDPEILFVAGHGREEIRRLMFREAEGIDAALETGPAGPARLRIPGAVSPGLLAARAMLYQALHFAAPTSQPPEVSGAGENRWLAGLMAAAGQEDHAQAVDDLVGLEGEVLGVDPVEVALDQALESFARRGAPVGVGRTAGTHGATGGAGWLLEDGPVAPEHLGRDGCLPPLVFSNSWCSLAWLGRRFLAAGASTFVGTSAPVFSRPARRFAAGFYGAMADGLCVGAAQRQAALALRAELGAEHPAWLAHGVQGYATLRLADL